MSKMITLTEFVRPNGAQHVIEYDPGDDEVYEKWKRIVDNGFRLECEMLSTGHASFTVTDDTGDAVITLTTGVAATQKKLVSEMIRRFDIDKHVARRKSSQEEEE